jgi:N-formylglutamate amidohydrolase
MSSRPRDVELVRALSATPRPLDPELAPPFELVEPEQLCSPLVFSSPHSGSVYPARFLEKSRLDLSILRRSEDAHVHALFASAAAVGAPLLRAHFPRAYLDLNREPYELDQRMFDSALPEFVNARSLRVAAGLGTIPRVVAETREIYAARLEVEDALHRIESLYKPYHLALRHLMERARRRFGVAVLVDCHSMPSANAKGGAQSARGDKRRADFVIGDRFGVSCSSEIVGAIERCLRQWGYQVQRNRPYAGGFITEHYGKPGEGWHAVQIEIARGLYMDESSLQRGEDFDMVAGRLGELIRVIAQVVGVRDQRAAAE